MQSEFAPKLNLNLLAGIEESFEIDGNSIIRTFKYSNFEVRSMQKLTISPVDAMKDPFAAWWKSFIDDEFSFGPKAELGPKAINYIDLFSSVGGLSLGFEEACRAMGSTAMPLLAVDIDDLALRIHKANHMTQRTLNQSVASLVDFKVTGKGETAEFAYEPELIGETISTLKNKVDVIIAGPPCQGHSTLNNHSRSDDPRNLLYLTVPALAVALNVKSLIIENVPNVVNDKESVVSSAINLLKTNGFHITEGVLQAHHLGWPQTRKRYFLVASRGSAPISIKLIAEQFKRDSLPVTWAISDFVVEREDQDHLMNGLPEMSLENQERVNWLFDNSSFELPNHVRPICHQDGHTYPSVYGRMKPNEPAPTLTTGFMSPGRGRFIHPLERRMLTPREAARLQGFPNWFNFMDRGTTKKSDLAKWIGDAVPSILGYFASLSLVGDLFQNSN